MMIIAVLTRILHYFSEYGADGRIRVMVRRVAAHVRIGKGRQVVGGTHLRHRIALRSDKWRAGVRREVSCLGG